MCGSVLHVGDLWRYICVVNDGLVILFFCAELVTCDNGFLIVFNFRLAISVSSTRKIFAICLIFQISINSLNVLLLHYARVNSGWFLGKLCKDIPMSPNLNVCGSAPWSLA